MIHNRNVCKQVDLTDNDLLILLHLGVPVEPRKTDRQDAAIMKLRALASDRGATPAEIQANVMRFES